MLARVTITSFSRPGPQLRTLIFVVSEMFEGTVFGFGRAEIRSGSENGIQISRSRSVVLLIRWNCKQAIIVYDSISRVCVKQIHLFRSFVLVNMRRRCFI